MTNHSLRVQVALLAYARSFRTLIEPLQDGDGDAARSARRLARSLARLGTAGSFAPVAEVAARVDEASDAELSARAADLLSALAEAVDGETATHLRILVVDGDGERRSALVQQLWRADQSILSAATAAEALGILQTGEIAAVLLAPRRLPDLDGRDLLCQIRAAPETTWTPVLVLGDSDGDVLRAECIALGADSYIASPWDPEEINARITARLARIAERSQVTERDALTGMLNRSAFQAAMRRILAERDDCPGPVSFGLIDLDHFGEVNNAFDWNTGSRVLEWIARILMDAARTEDVLGRVGGDDFGLLFPGINREAAVRFMTDVLSRVRQHTFRGPDGERFQITFTGSVVEIGDSETSGDAFARANRLARSPYASRGNTILADEALHPEATPTILFAEDNELVASVVIHRLEREGFHVVHCTDGRTALDRALSGPIALVITNVGLPRMDGFTLVERLRSIPPADRTPVMFLTSRGRQEDLQHGFELGADDYMVKPFSPNELVVRAHRLLRIRS